MDDIDSDFKKFLARKVNSFESYILCITRKESRLIDWIITLHSWDNDLFERLRSPDKMNLRERIGEAFISEELNSIFDVEITKDELQDLLVLIPNSYQIGSEDVGMSLKVKLYKLLLGISEEGGELNANKNSDQTDYETPT